MTISFVSAMRSYEYKELLSYYQLSGHFVMPQNGNSTQKSNCDLVTP